MGLDMYMTGRKFFVGWGPNAQKREEEGFEVESIEVKLGYWRKHPDLHGFIVGNFGPECQEGVQYQATVTGPDGTERIDNCEAIELDIEQITKIIDAVKNRSLAKGQTGFFFGQSATDDDPEAVKQEMDDDLEQLGHAVAWMTKLEAHDGLIRSVVYRASW